MGMSFSLALTAVQAPLINAIKNYIDTLSIKDDNLKLSPYSLEIVSPRSYLTHKNKSTDNGNLEFNCLKTSKRGRPARYEQGENEDTSSAFLLNSSLLHGARAEHGRPVEGAGRS